MVIGFVAMPLFATTCTLGMYVAAISARFRMREGSPYAQHAARDDLLHLHCRMRDCVQQETATVPAEPWDVEKPEDGA